MRRTFLSTGTPQTRCGQDGSERWYVLQNWRQDAVAIIDEAAVQRERVFYSPYGRVFGMVAGDTPNTGFDGSYGGTDDTAIGNWTGYDAYVDVDLDGDVDTTDASFTTNASLGWEVLSRDGSTIGYAGYVQDDSIATVSHVRHRVYKSDLGRWVKRDPAGYVDGANLYEYVMSQPIEMRDAMGLQAGGGSSESDPCAKCWKKYSLCIAKLEKTYNQCMFAAAVVYESCIFGFGAFCLGWGPGMPGCMVGVFALCTGVYVVAVDYCQDIRRLDIAICLADLQGCCPGLTFD